MKTEHDPGKRLLLAALGLCGLLACTAPAPARAGAALPPALVERLAQAAVVHTRFTQVKTLAALRRPLETSGELVFARGHGVIWRIERPYRIGYAITAEEVTEIAPDGTRSVRSARELPAFAHIGRVFEAIFTGDPAALEAQFTIAAEGDERAWRMVLTPVAPLDRFLTRITAEGGEFLARVEVQEAGGDQTRIEFAAPRLSAAPDAGDAQLLGIR